MELDFLPSVVVHGIVVSHLLVASSDGSFRSVHFDFSEDKQPEERCTITSETNLGSELAAEFPFASSSSTSELSIEQ